MGAPFIDYLLADRRVIPQDEHRFYTKRWCTCPAATM